MSRKPLFIEMAIKNKYDIKILEKELINFHKTYYDIVYNERNKTIKKVQNYKQNRFSVTNLYHDSVFICLTDHTYHIISDCIQLYKH